MIKYPIKKNTSKKEIEYGGRGSFFEESINESNKYYLVHDIAIIHKKPTPIRVVEVSYPSRNEARITKAFYSTPSTTDYNGIYKGKYIDFETKQINSKTSIPLSVIHPHQIKHLESVDRHGAISFILVYFKTLNEIYLLETKYLVQFYNRSFTGRKSISLTEFKEFGYLVEQSYAPKVKYIDIINKLIDKEKE